MALRLRGAARLLLSRMHHVAASSQWWRSPSPVVGVGKILVSSEPGRLLSQRPLALQVRQLTSDMSILPDIKDESVKKALNGLLGSSWSKIEPNVKASVQTALSSNSGDNVGNEALTSTWQSAQAVEKFSETLTGLLMELSDMSGGTGEDVSNIPDPLYKAVEAAHRKYTKYLESFDDDREGYLKKKVENELGGMLLQIKMRCAGLHPKWGKVTLLGTSGLSGSYIERRG